MSRWITITVADLYNSKVAALIDAANSVALAPGQTDRITGVIADVTLEIRRKVACAKDLDSVTTAIPGGLKTLAVDMIYCRLKMALEMELSQDERDLLRARQRDLDRVADGTDMVDLPDNPISTGTVMQSANAVQYQAGSRKATRDSMDGI